MATLSEHADKISAAIEAARKDGFRLCLEEGGHYEDAHVDLEEYSVEYAEEGAERTNFVGWQTIIVSFD